MTKNTIYKDSLARKQRLRDKKNPIIISPEKNNQNWKKLKITNFIPHEKLIEAEESIIRIFIKTISFSTVN